MAANLFNREDTFFGVCAGVGEDLGFNPDWLRIAFAALLFFNPLIAVEAYAALGAVVLATRLVFRAPKPAAAAPAVAADNDAAQVALPLAA